MPRVSDMFPSRWLKASDCEDGDLTLTIERIVEESVGQGRDAEDKWIVYFAEHDKGLVLNKTNMNTIAKLHGDDTDDWINRQVTLYSTEVQFQGDMVEAIRVRSRPPRPARRTRPSEEKPAPAPAARPVAAREPGDDDAEFPY
jgi:hypothetical protein